jgi:hypothetical protein
MEIVRTVGFETDQYLRERGVVSFLAAVERCLLLLTAEYSLVYFAAQPVGTTVDATESSVMNRDKHYSVLSCLSLSANWQSVVPELK